MQAYVLAVSHCVLNQNVVINGWERAPGPFPFVPDILAQNISILQLPCPELQFAGANRPSCTYQDYNTPAYRSLCRSLAESQVEQIRQMQQKGVVFLGLLGIHNSPTCSVTGQRGVFMQEFMDACRQADIPCPHIEVPEAYTHTDEGDFRPQLQQFIHHHKVIQNQEESL